MRVIAFEGLDGVGKTSAARRMAELLRGKLVTDICDPRHNALAAERKIVNQGADIEARFQYFLRLNERHISLARRLGIPGYSATLDTSIYRTIATHRVLGSKTAMGYEIPEVFKPDITYYLELDEAERQKRMIGRDGLLRHPSHWDERLFGLQDDLRHEYTKFGLIVIDASLSVDDIVGIAIERTV